MTASGGSQRDDRRALEATAAGSPSGAGVTELRETLHRLVADITGIPPEQIDDARPLAEYGLTSRGAVALSGYLEKMLDCSLPATLLLIYVAPTAPPKIGPGPSFSAFTMTGW